MHGTALLCNCVCVCTCPIHMYLSKNRHKEWSGLQFWHNTGQIVVTSSCLLFKIARGGQYLLGRDILLLAFVSLSRELVRLRHALEWRQ